MRKKMSLIKKIMLLMTCLGVLFLVSACGNKKVEPTKIKTASSYSVVDCEGTTVEFPKKPLRILSQSLTFDTMILGLVPPDRLVSCNILGGYPDASFIVEETKNVPNKLQSFVAIPVDMVIKLKPDLIVLPNTAKAEMISTFRDLGFSVLVCKSPANIEDIRDDIKLIAQALQEQAAGEKIIAEMDRQLLEIEDVLAKQTGAKPVGMLVSQMTNYGGKNSMFDVLCNKARVINGIAAVGLNNGEKLTKELVVKADPDFFMVSTPREKDENGTDKFKNEFLQDPAYRGMKGLNNIVPIPSRYLYTNSQNYVYAIKGIANYAYGEIFDLSAERLIKGY